jgi:uncharacterized protein
MLKYSERALVIVLALAVPAAWAQSTPAKKDLAAKIVQAQQPGIEQLARQIVEQPAIQMLQAAGRAVQQRVPAEQREAMARDLQADVRKFVDDTVPLVRQKAAALAPQTIAPLLEEKLTEAELREVLGVFNSAAWKKFNTLAPDMQKALGEKLVAEVKPEVEGRLKALDATLARRLGIQPGTAGSAPRPASAPR